MPTLTVSRFIKGWLDAAGKTHAQVYDVAWFGDRQPGKDGMLLAVGSTVDASTANFTNTIGSTELATRVDRSGL